jgi:hypothetical protein
VAGLVVTPPHRLSPAVTVLYASSALFALRPSQLARLLCSRTSSSLLRAPDMAESRLTRSPRRMPNLVDRRGAHVQEVSNAYIDKPAGYSWALFAGAFQHQHLLI